MNVIHTYLHNIFHKKPAYNRPSVGHPPISKTCRTTRKEFRDLRTFCVIFQFRKPPFSSMDSTRFRYSMFSVLSLMATTKDNVFRFAFVIIAIFFIEFRIFYESLELKRGQELRNFTTRL